MTNRREAILDAFSRLVSCYGLGKTSMQDVAKEMGISVGTIYNDFANKEDLILAFWQRVERQCIAQLDSVAKRDLAPEELLRHIMLEYIKMLSEQLRTNRGIYDLMMESSISYLGKSILGRRQIIQQALIKRVAGILGKGLESSIFEFSGEADVTAFYFVAAFTEYSAPPLIVSRDQEEVLQEVVAMFDFVIRALKSH